MSPSAGAIDVQQHYAPPSLIETLEELRPESVGFLITELSFG